MTTSTQIWRSKMKNLFDFNAGGSSAEEDLNINSFLGKLESIEKDFSEILGERAVNFAHTIVSEYTMFLDYKSSINEINEKFIKQIQDNVFVMKSTFDYDYFINEKDSKRIYKMMKNRIINFIRNTYSVSISEDSFNTQYEDDEASASVVDYLSENSILEFIASKTNNGNAEEISKQQMLNALYTDVRRNSIKLVKKVIQISDLFATDCTFEPRVCHWCERNGFFNALLSFCKEDFPGSNKTNSHIGQIEAIYTYSPRGYQGEDIFHKQEFTGNFIVSTKLLKNGRFDMEFKTPELAARFYQDYLVECKAKD